MEDNWPKTRRFLFAQPGRQLLVNRPSALAREMAMASSFVDRAGCGHSIEKQTCSSCTRITKSDGLAVSPVSLITFQGKSAALTISVSLHTHRCHAFHDVELVLQKSLNCFSDTLQAT
jgi:hypothetical protein